MSYRTYERVDDSIDEDYFMWLCELVDSEDPDNGYTLLMRILFEFEFSEETARLVKNDCNRIEDGLDMRSMFEREEGLEQGVVLEGRPCSMLEMLVALAGRIESSFGQYSRCYWFWEMMRNIDMDQFTDGVLRKRDERFEECIFSLEKVRSRKYDRYGYGGLFPLRESDKNQRNVEIWYQCSYYLVENYM